MLATWIRRFTDKNEKANNVADTWASIITHAFSSGSFSHIDYVSAYKNIFGANPYGGRKEVKIV
jgi:membrane associated rhomboid family serine protease